MAKTVKRSISFDADVLRDAEAVASDVTGGNLSALVGEAVVQHVKAIRGRDLMREDRRQLGPVAPEVLAAIDDEWPA